MEQTELALVVLITLAVIILITLILFLIAKRPSFISNKGKVMFELNAKKRKFRYIFHDSMSQNKIPHTQNMIGVYDGKWQSFDRISKIFSESSIKSFKLGMHFLENQVDEEYSFQAKFKRSFFNKKQHDFKMDVNMHNVKNGSINVTFIYEFKDKEAQKVKYPEFTSNAFSNWKSETATVIMFNTEASSFNKIPQIINLFKKYTGEKEMQPMLYKDRLCLAIYTNNEKRLGKKIEKNTKLIIDNIFKNGIGAAVSAVGYITTQRPNTPKKILNAIIQLEYLIYKSKNTKTIESLKEDDFEELQTFQKEYIAVEQAIRVGDIEFKNTKVKNYKTSRPVVEFGYASIEHVSPNWLRKILLIDYLRKKLIDSHIDSINNKNLIKPIIIDVNKKWFIKNYKNIKNKNIVYTVDIMTIEKRGQLLATMSQLQETGIFCGARLSNLDLSVINFIEKARPKFIIIDHSISSKIYDQNIYLKLINLNKIIQGKGIKLIYETPIKTIDQRQVEQIGLEFYYDYR